MKFEHELGIGHVVAMKWGKDPHYGKMSLQFQYHFRYIFGQKKDKSDDWNGWKEPGSLVLLRKHKGEKLCMWSDGCLDVLGRLVFKGVLYTLENQTAQTQSTQYIEAYVHT